MEARGHGHIDDMRHRRHPRLVTFTQVRGHMDVQAGAVCKTVGSAYVGSHPTPATRFRRSKPVTSDCVTGFCEFVGAAEGAVEYGSVARDRAGCRRPRLA